MPPARISLTLSRHFSLFFITSGRSSGLHPISLHSCCMYVRAGRPAFAQPYVGVHRSTSLMSSSLLLQQCPACLVRLTWIVFMMGGRWPYSWCLVWCCCQDLFNIACNTRHGQLSIGYRSYGNQTWPIKWNAVSSRQRSYWYCCMDALLLRTISCNKSTYFSCYA